VEQFLKLVRRYRRLDLRRMAEVFALSIAAHAASTASLMLMGQSLAIHLGIGEWAWIRSCSLLLSMLPITIRGLGVRETTFLFFLQPYGVTAAQVVALSLVRMATGLCMAILGGLIEMKSLLSPGRRLPAPAAPPSV
jgi:uncharacterized membrane protein YbhN (UPF0104 family)